ncbi:MAG: nucleoside triphosphate pyrophosphohydrolase family protein [Anaerolineae bacterium]|nr:nucleoside triphosphate pyrophosphohydrolase family protein [Anaerolineae bacterium]
MDFRQYQQQATALAIYPNRGSNPIYPTLGLAGESGEVCDKVKKVLRDKNGQFDAETIAAIRDELGDVLWYIANLSAELGVDLDDVAARNIDKLQSRRERGVLGGSGDNR